MSKRTDGQGGAGGAADGMGGEIDGDDPDYDDVFSEESVSKAHLESEEMLEELDRLDDDERHHGEDDQRGRDEQRSRDDQREDDQRRDDRRERDDQRREGEGEGKPRNFEEAYYQQVSATRESRERIRQLESDNQRVTRLFDRIMDSLERTGRMPAEFEGQRSGGRQGGGQQDDFLAQLPQIKDKYEDPIEEIADLRKGLEFFVNVVKTNYQNIQERNTAQTQEEQEFEEDRRYINGVAERVAKWANEGDLPELASAFDKVLEGQARILYDAESRPNMTRAQEDKLWRSCVNKTSKALHRRAAALMDQNKSPIDELFAMATRYGYQRANGGDDGRGNGRDDRRRDDQRSGRRQGDEDRYRARQQLRSPLGRRGGGQGGRATMEEMADALDELSDEEFDQRFAEAFGLPND